MHICASLNHLYLMTSLVPQSSSTCHDIRIYEESVLNISAILKIVILYINFSWDHFWLPMYFLRHFEDLRDKQSNWIRWARHQLRRIGFDQNEAGSQIGGGTLYLNRHILYGHECTYVDILDLLETVQVCPQKTHHSLENNNNSWWYFYSIYL